jgi:molybdopterin molybdotransferase
MIPLEQAQDVIRGEVRPLTVGMVPLLDCLGLFLAESLHAPRSLPPFDNSAMDGFAVRAVDTQGANRDHPALFRLVGTSVAGSNPEQSIRPGETIRILTGAPIPEGADAVVRQEAAEARDNEVRVFLEVPLGKNIRRRGEELIEGSCVLRSGQRINAHAIGLAASLGWATLPVRRHPKVAVLTVGDELQAPGSDLGPSGIHDSNGALLLSLAREAGAQVLTHERCRDDRLEIVNALERCVSGADLVVTCGGASVGDRDLVKQAVTAGGGRLIFDRTAIKPGTPAAFGTFQDRPIVVLPGNPGAATVAFDQLARPALFRLQGVREVRIRREVPLPEFRSKQPNLTALLSASWDPSDPNSVRVRPQGAGQIFHNLDARGWIRLPAGSKDFEAGTNVELECFESPSYEVDT